MKEKNPSFDLLERMLTYLNLSMDLAVSAQIADDKKTLERLQYLINTKCTRHDIQVLLATAEALTAPTTSFD